MSDSLTIERLRELLDYDPATGTFCWKVRRGPSALAGSVAGSVSKADSHHGGGYRWIRIDGTDYLAHRLAWFCVTGEWPTGHVDHENRNRDDNRFDNLRDATRTENGANRARQANNTSGYKGVSFHKGANRWIANIQANGRTEYLGLFDSALDAHRAYSAAAERLFGEFARVA